MNILELLQKACTDKGINSKYAAQIEKAMKVKTAEEIEAAVDNFKDNILPAIEEAGKSGVADYEKKFNLKDGHKIDSPKPTDPTPPAPTGIDPDIKKLLDAQSEQITKLSQLVQNNASAADLAEKRATATQLIKEANLPENWASRIDLESDTSYADQVKTLQTEYTSIQQQGINARVEAGEFTPGFQPPKERSEEEWAKLMTEEEDASDAGVVDLGL